ncbi:TPA: DNA-methyltransferase [Vibrio diabolicus]|uniref:DNA-methyltransferase n=1 Tax=Photobacterium sp. (strain ATCC 43367) TaxID=379097 RepID=UPI00057C4370|nr:site-specific DNA-methyltransferase [Vibrio sinaloensis]KHT39924.1 restriction endonuclease HpaI [Vibrio sinaloensis]
MKLKRFIHGSCDTELDKLIESGITFDLILTDPPYNLKKDFGNDSDNLSISDFINVNRRRISQCKELLKKDGSIIWFGIHNYICYIQIIMYELELHYRRMNLWNYSNGFSRSKKVPANVYEPFLWFSKSNKKWTYNVDDVRVPYKSSERLKNPVYYKDNNGNRKEWKPNPLGAMRSDIWEYPTLSGKLFKDERTEHPTQKPESLITEIIKAFCPKNENGYYEGTILDPFGGSGTLGICCEKLNQQGHNIDWLSIELERKWVDVSNQRLKSLS